MTKRRIFVPGRPVEVSVIISDALKQVVLGVPHRGEIIVVFVGEKPTARAMDEEQARQFYMDLKEIHVAAKDDVVLERMEKEFGE